MKKQEMRQCLCAFFQFDMVQPTDTADFPLFTPPTNTASAPIFGYLNLFKNFRTKNHATAIKIKYTTYFIQINSL